MKFDNSFYLDEIRDSFYVTGLMKRLWAAQLTVLEDVAKICSNHGIRWFLDCGSLLGAVRHGGYIPWDDDVDICMLREDYDRFGEIARRELPDNYTVYDFHSHDYWSQLIRISNTDTIKLDQQFLSKYSDFPYPAGIDVFCLDYISPDEEKERERCELAKAVMSIAVSSELRMPYSEDILEVVHALEGICGVSFVYDDSLKRQLYLLGEKYYSMFRGEGAKEVALMNYWIDNGSHKYPVEYFEQAITLDFEGLQLPVPAGYLEKLSRDYGAYWKINRAGGIHDYPIFGANEKILMKMAGDTYPFYYKPAENWRECPEREEWHKNKSQINGYFDLLEGVCQSFQKVLIDDEKKREEVLDLLKQSQSVAIMAGECIEREIGEGTDEVRCLEKYCDYVFEGFERVVSGEIKLTETAGKMLNSIKSARACFEKRVNNNKVIILTCRASWWKYLDGLYRLLKQEKIDVSVVILPYYMRDALGNIGEMVYEAEKYPDDIDTINYAEYDIKMNRPSVVISQAGHDQTGYTCTVPVNYYCANIRKYTEQLIYYSPYCIDEYDENDMKMNINMEHMAYIPGTFLCDSLVVYNDFIKTVYKNYLIKASEGQYDKAILSLDELKERLTGIKQCISHDKTDDKSGNEEKKLLIYISLSTLLVHREEALEKIAQICNVTENCNEISYMWFMPEADRQFLIKSDKALLDKIQAILGQSFIFCDKEDEIYKCSAYYGDASRYARNFQLNNKPVMIMNINCR